MLLFLVMDDFVRNKLTEWGLSELIERFEEQGIDKESLSCLDDKHIDKLISKVGPNAKFKKRLKLLKEEQKTTNQETVDSSAQCQQEHEEAAAQVRSSTSDTSDKGKRKLDLQGESSKLQSPQRKQRRELIPERKKKEEIILSDVKDIMTRVHKRIPEQDNKLNKFLKNKIHGLETDKRELVGVFGKTGAGKSSLINAVIGEKNLLPSGSVSACTSVMIKVEANMQDQNYEAHIEFITKEEWKEELWSFNFLRGNIGKEKEDVEDYRDTVEKLSALYGEEWRKTSCENLMDDKYFREIPEFLNSMTKILTFDTAKELSAEFVKYTRNDSKDRGGKAVKRKYWPLLKCVTVRVPDNDLLQHVTLVDLPGNGDRNKSRDKMWKEVVGSCSTVWIVTEVNRAAAEKEAWEILETASSLMGNGGECQQIHFICTKSDIIEDSDGLPAAGVRARILQRNEPVKEEVKEEFSKLHQVKKHFGDECFKVFTVSSKEFLKKKHLNQDDTEIPKLCEFLQNLNDRHSETLNYVPGAYGILSLIQGASCRKVDYKKTDVCTQLEEKMKQELDKVREEVKDAYEAFEKCLSEGVEKSKRSCEGDLKSFLYPSGVQDMAFHRTLRSVVQKYGIHKTTAGKQINLNMKLASYLTGSIDEEFRKTFPNERKRGPFNGVINTFSLDTERLIQKYKDVELQLIFLKTEEEKIKTDLNRIIREYKKKIYSSLMTTIEETMKECYEEAARFTGEGSLNNMRDTIKKHVRGSKDTMFEEAKGEMLKQLRDLKEDIMKTLEETMQESIELSLKTDGVSIPDVTVELTKVKKYHNELKGSPDEHH